VLLVDEVSVSLGGAALTLAKPCESEEKIAAR